MPRTVWILVVGLTATALAAGGGYGAVPTAGWPALLEALNSPVADPLPIRRVRVAENQVEELRKATEAGPLVRMPRADFENRVRDAAQAVRERGTPTLVDAIYTARLVENDLVGDATWTFENPHALPAAFSLESLRLAVTGARWKGGSPAVLGLLGPGFPAGASLWVPVGRQVLTLDWSAMGTAEPGERRFELRVPPTLSSSLELELPEDRVAISSGAEVLLTGPFPAKTSGRRLWRFRFGAATRFELAVRSASSSPTARDPVRASLMARYDIDPTQTQGSFEYDLVPVRGSVSEWQFDVDPGVRILDAVATDRGGWQVEPPAAPGAPSLLRVRLRQPGPGGKVLITALAPPVDPVNSDLPLPMIRPRNGRVDEEKITVRLAPDLKPAGWSPGDYRLLGITSEADRGIALSFTGSLLPVGALRGNRRPPGVSAATAAPEFDTRESLEWSIESGRVMLDVILRIHVRKGSLFALPVQLTPGYLPLRTSSLPAEAMSFASPLVGTPPIMTIEFQKPITEGHDVDLHLEFRGPAIPATARAEAPAKLAVPRVTPLGAVERQGAFTVTPTPGWQVYVRAQGVNAAAEGASLGYRGREPEGSLFLAPWAPDWAATSRTTIARVDGQLLARTRLAIRIPSGTVSALTLLVPEEGTNQRTWQVVSKETSLATVQEVPLADLPAWLPLMAPFGGGWNRLLVAPLQQTTPLTAWRLTLTQPARNELLVESSAPISAVPEASVPLLTLAECNTQSGLATLDEKLSREFLLESQGRDASGLRDLRIPTRVRLQRLAVSAVVGQWKYDALRQVSKVDGSGDVRVTFAGRVRSAGGPVLTLTLPTDAIVESVGMAGHAFSPHCGFSEQGAEGPVLRMPVPTAADVPFEVHYRLPASLKMGMGRIVSPRPRLPGDSLDCERTWILGPDVAALGPLTSKPIGSENPLELLKTGHLGNDALAFPAESDSLLVAHASVLAAARYLASAAILALGWWLATRPRRPSARVLIAAVVVFALGSSAEIVIGATHFRWPVLAAGAALAMLLIARGRRPETEPADSSTMNVRMIAAFLAVFAPVTMLQAQAPEPIDVFLLAGGDVLVPQALLERLDRLAKPLEPGVVITAAKYDGQSAEESARITAQFTVQNFSKEPASLTLPLGEARLEEVRIGEARAFPQAIGGDVYSLMIPASGPHLVTASFTVPVKVAGNDREVRFGIPEVPESRLSWTASIAARQLTAIGWRGQQITDGVRLRVDLGSSRGVHLRWREGPGFGTTANLSARQASVWSVSEAGAELTVVYLVSVTQGTTNGFRFELPGDLDLTRVAVRSPDSATSVVLRDWTIGPVRDGTRPVRVQLQSPLEGRAYVILEAVPTSILSTRSLLRFPRIVAATLESSLYGFRSERVTIASLVHTGLEHAGNDTLTRDFPGVSDLQFPGITAPRVFRAVGGATPEFRVSLQAARPASVTQQLAWSVTSGRRAEGLGSLRWAAKDDPLSAVEFDLPPAVKLLEVRGPEIQGWASSALGRVQVWFKSPQAEPTVEWVGSMAAGLAAAKGLDPLLFEPPVARAIGLVSTTVQVSPPEGWGWRVERDRGWTVAPATGRGLAYRAEGSPLVPQWTFYPPRTNSPPTRGLGWLEMSPAGVLYRVTQSVPLLRDRPTHLVLRVSDVSPLAVVEPVMPPDVRLTPLITTGPIREWDVDVPARAGEPLRSEVLIRLPLPNEETDLPGVALEVAGGPPLPMLGVQWIGLVGTTAEAWRLRGAVPGPTRWDAFKAEWPRESDDLRKRTGTLWVPRGPRAAVRLDPGNLPSPSLMESLSTDTPSASTPAIEPGIPDLPPPTVEPSLRFAPFVAWWAGLALLVLLALRFPRSTWPEQLGLLTALVLLFLGESPILAILVPIGLRVCLFVLNRRAAHSAA